MEEPILVKKEKLTDKLMKKQNKVLIIAVFCILTVVIGSSYALLTNFDQTEEVITVSTGNLTMTINNVLVELNNKLPESDANGLTNASPVTVTITNTGTMTIMKYELKLLNDSTETSTLPYNYIKYAISEDGTNYGTPQNLGSVNNIIFAGYSLEVNASKTIYLKAWVDESAGNNALNKTFYGSVTAVLYQKAGIPFQEKLPKNVSYILSYNATKGDASFDTQDTVGTNSNKLDVLYYTGSEALEHGNVLFAGFCWQIIRTTDTGGLRIIYNGPAENNKCLTTRNSGGTLKGINADDDGTSQSMSGTSTSTLYGSGYTYDLDAGTFSLTGTFSGKTWSTDYDDIIGNYTCLDTSGTNCSTLYYIGLYRDSSSAYVAKYQVGTVASNSQIGTTPYNTHYASPALVGYMYNKAYTYKSGAKTGDYANSVTWDSTNNIYVLDSSTTTNLSAPDATHHYVCDTDCTKVRFYYCNNSGTYYYVLLENGDTNPVYVMLNGKTQNETDDANINRYSSAIKGQLDNWYKKNIDTLSSSVKGLIDTSAVYCNDRSTTDIQAWDKDTAITSTVPTIKFYQYNVNKDLRCANVTDRFSKENEKANLTYPVGLITEPERNLMSSNYAATGQYYWGVSPFAFNYYTYYDAGVRVVNTSGATGNDGIVDYANGARPLVSLRPDADIEEGDGSYDTPYVIGDKISR